MSRISISFFNLHIMKALKVFILLLLIPISLLARVPEKELISLNNQRVIDQTGILQSYEKNQLIALSEEIEQKSGAQYVIVLMNTTSPYTIEDYAFSLGEYWGLGTEKADNGVIMLVAMQDKKMRIEVGYGLEGVIPDALAKRIIETQLKPNFRNQDFYQGIYSGSVTVKELIFKEPVSDDNFKKEKKSNKFSTWMFLFPVFMIALLFLKDKFGALKGIGLGIVVLVVIMALLSSIQFALLYNFMLGVFTTLFGNSKGGGGGGRYHGGYGGSYGGGFSSGGFSGGGFSGGGGSFGGGGASGGW